MLANLLQDVPHQCLRDIEPAPTQVCDDGRGGGEPPRGRGATDDAKRSDDSQPHGLRATAYAQVVEDHPVGAMAQCIGDNLRLADSQVPGGDFGGCGLRGGEAVGRVSGQLRKDRPGVPETVYLIFGLRP